MMGLFTLTVGSPWYSLTSPVFDKVTLHLDKRYYPQGDLVIEAKRPSKNSYLIKSMWLGEKPLKRYRISHDELVKAGQISFDFK